MWTEVPKNQFDKNPCFWEKSSVFGKRFGKLLKTLFFFGKIFGKVLRVYPFLGNCVPKFVFGKTFGKMLRLYLFLGIIYPPISPFLGKARDFQPDLFLAYQLICEVWDRKCKERLQKQRAEKVY